MKRIAAIIALLYFSLIPRFELEAKRPPNVVLILIDDYGWGDTGCYGSDFYRTPNLDALAARGIRFTDAYAAAPVCSPSRAALMTGKSPARLHLTDWLPGRGDRPDQKLARPVINQQLALEEMTLAEALRAAGYATAHIGKWHLGGKGFEPERQGFDLNIAGDHTGTPRSYFAPFENKDGKMAGLGQAPANEYLPDRLTDEAVKFIERSKDKPFFLYLPHYAVHIPLRAKADLIANYEAAPKGKRHNNAVYAAMIESMDESVGRIVRKIDELNLTGDTLIIFTSDNGGLTVKEGLHTPATDNAPLHAGKGYLYEGGIRVPMIIAGAGVARPGRTNSTPVIGTDLFPTILEMAGVKSSNAADGVSFAKLLKGAETMRRPPLYWHYPHYSNQGRNGGSGGSTPGGPGGMIRDGDFKLIELFEDNHVELYNLKQDLGETSDLSKQMPAKAAAMRKRLDAWRKAVGAQRMSPNPAYRP